MQHKHECTHGDIGNQRQESQVPKSWSLGSSRPWNAFNDFKVPGSGSVFLDRCVETVCMQHRVMPLCVIGEVICTSCACACNCEVA